MEERSFDLVVLGGGPGGYSAGLWGVTRGLKACVVEMEHVGGTCLNWGCFPTKSLLRDALLFSEARSAGFFEGDIKLNYGKVIERKDAVVTKLVQGVETILLNRGVALIEGKGRLLDSKSVIVRTKDRPEIVLKADKMVLATGAKLDPSPFSIDHERILGSRDALTLKTLPKALAIVGCGRRGVEFGTIFRSFGCEVVLIEKGDRILPREDAEISHRLRRILSTQGMKMMISSEALGAKVSDRGKVLLTLGTKKGESQIEVDNVLVPGKRVGNTEGLGLEEIGVRTRDGFIEVNEAMETSVPGLYAAGDVNGRGALAHKAIAEGVLSVDRFTRMEMKINPQLIPRCTYTNPEVGSIGLTQAEAEEKGEEIEVGKFPIGASGRALTLGQDQGIVKIIFGKKYGEILGAHILAPQATELISLASVAMRNEMGIEELKAAVYGHPTVSEAIFEAALDVKGEAIHFLKGS